MLDESDDGDDRFAAVQGIGNGIVISLIMWIVLFAMFGLMGCEDKAYPLDCPNACVHRLD